MDKKCEGIINSTNKGGGDPCTNLSYAYYKSELTSSGRVPLCRLHSKGLEMIEVLKK